MSFVPLLPNWRDGVREVLAYQTSVFTSRAGRETREAQRDTPRRSLEFTVTLRGDALPDLRDYLLRQQTVEPYRILDPTGSRGVLGAQVSSGSDTFTLTTDAPAWAVAGSRGVLFTPLGAEEVTIDSVVGGAVTLTAPVGQDWATGSKFGCSIEGRFSGSPQLAHASAGFAEWAVSFDVLPGSETLSVPEPPEERILAQREVLTHRPNWRVPVDVTMESRVQVVDYGRGRTAAFNPEAHGPRIFTSLHTLHGDQATALVDSFHRAKGRRGEFFEPTWTADLTLSADPPVSAAVLRVSDPTLAARFGDLMTYGGVAVLLRDGTLVPLMIESITSAVDYSDIELSDALWSSVSSADVRMVCWMPLKRFASDALTIEWVSESVAETVLSTYELPMPTAAEAEGDLPGEAAQYLIDLYGTDFTKNNFMDPINVAVNITYPAIWQ